MKKSELISSCPQITVRKYYGGKIEKPYNVSLMRLLDRITYCFGRSYLIIFCDYSFDLLQETNSKFGC